VSLAIHPLKYAAEVNNNWRSSSTFSRSFVACTQTFTLYYLYAFNTTERRELEIIWTWKM